MAAILRLAVKANCAGALGLWRSQKPSSSAAREHRLPERPRWRHCEPVWSASVGDDCMFGAKGRVIDSQ